MTARMGIKLPFTDQLPMPVRRLGRAFLGPGLRARVAAELQHLAHVQSYRHPLYRRSQGQLRELRDRHRGESCVILGNGPSLAQLDLADLDGLPAFCLNRGYLKWREAGRRPAYAVAVNDLVIAQFGGELASLGCPLFVPWQHHARFADCEAAILLEMRWRRRFFADIRRGLWPGATVTFAALQIAYFMGFRTVVLAGVDHRFQRSGPAHAEVVQPGDDGDHFTTDYFGAGVHWNLPDLDQSEMAYRLARDAYARDGRRVIDGTAGGALEVFEKLPLAEALAVARERRRGEPC